jgi:hypothetical protein
MSNEKKKEKEEDKEWVFFGCTFLGLLQQFAFFAREPFCIDLIFIYFICKPGAKSRSSGWRNAVKLLSTSPSIVLQCQICLICWRREH